MPDGRRMAKLVKETTGESLDQAIPRLMKATERNGNGGSVGAVAIKIGVAPGSVKTWLHNHDTFFVEGKWQVFPGSTERVKRGEPIILLTEPA